MNGNNTLIAAPRNMLQNVGGEYNIRGLDEGGDEDGSSDDGDPDWTAA